MVSYNLKLCLSYASQDNQWNLKSDTESEIRMPLFEGF
jgi:hypothetical protein